MTEDIMVGRLPDAEGDGDSIWLSELSPELQALAQAALHYNSESWQDGAVAHAGLLLRKAADAFAASVREAKP